MSAPRWVPVTEALPPFDISTLLWGSKLETGLDHPLPGRLCGCHEQWVLDFYVDDNERSYGDVHENDKWSSPERDPFAEEHTRRMLGEVTHWLDWRPGPEER